MLTKKSRTRLAASLPILRTLLLGAIAAGCGPVVDNITVHSASAIVSDPRAATFVVIQPESDLHSVNLVDGHGQLVGQLDGRSQTIVRLPEGPTLLYAVLDNRAGTADRLEGTLIPGRVYYATVGARPGGVALLALTPRSPNGRWNQKAAYLTATPRVEMDGRRLSHAVNQLGGVLPIMEAGDARAAKLDAASAGEHTIQETDGF
jgi:hypothetical protein